MAKPALELGHKLDECHVVKKEANCIDAIGYSQAGHHLEAAASAVDLRQKAVDPLLIGNFLGSEGLRYAEVF